MESGKKFFHGFHENNMFTNISTRNPGTTFMGRFVSTSLSSNIFTTFGSTCASSNIQELCAAWFYESYLGGRAVVSLGMYRVTQLKSPLGWKTSTSNSPSPQASCDLFLTVTVDSWSEMMTSKEYPGDCCLQSLIVTKSVYATGRWKRKQYCREGILGHPLT